MATSTNKLALTKPAGTDPMLHTPLNNNWETLDDVVPTKVCTSSTRPVAPFLGQLIYETDTDRLLIWDGTKWQILTNKPRCEVELTAAETFDQNGKIIPWDAETVDTDGFWAVTPNPTRLTIPTGLSGVYMVACSYRTLTIAADQAGQDCAIYKNGTRTFGTKTLTTNNDHEPAIQVVIIDHNGNAGDYYEMWLDTNEGVTFTLESVSKLTRMNIQYLF